MNSAACGERIARPRCREASDAAHFAAVSFPHGSSIRAEDPNRIRIAGPRDLSLDHDRSANEVVQPPFVVAQPNHEKANAKKQKGQGVA